jgi:serine/threonine-protein kinase
MDKVYPNNQAPRLDMVQRHLEKIVVSAEMRRSKKLCQFLRFTVEEVLRGHGSELKEYAIGVGVFRRGREFDTGADPIVRVQARRLRAKLQQYYQAEGRDEPMRIEYPVGSYSPVFVQRTPQTQAAFPGPSIKGRLSTPSKLIAVLPFIGLGAEGSEAFSEGLSDELIHALSSCDGIQVIARSSSFQFKGRSEDVRSIGESLGASALVSGSVRIEGPRLRVLAQLIDAESGVNLQSSAYDRELGGILATQQEISRDLTAMVKVQFASLAPGDKSNHAVVEPSVRKR